jgi:predicted O-methyltransferase YrrM
MVYRYFDGRPPSLEPIRQRNDSYRCSLWREADLAKIFDAPAQLSMGERMTLFSLTLGRRPARAVEIGSFRGGSAQIIVHAMDLNGFGELVMIDPTPQFAPSLWDGLSHRTMLVSQASPAAFAAVQGFFDFAFIDAIHTRESVRADLTAVAERLRPDGIVLLHDVLHPNVRAGIEDVLQSSDLIDCGCICTNASFDGAGMSWAGLGMVRKPAQGR